MGKYEKSARELLEYVGRRENISVVTHCATRMRFVLKDPKKADVKKVETIEQVKGTFTQCLWQTKNGSYAYLVKVHNFTFIV